jgi:hypothetical protein
MNNDQLDHILSLLQEALRRLDRLGSPYQPELAPAFASVIHTMSAPVASANQRCLLIGAARSRVITVERRVVNGMIRDNSISSFQMPDLLRVRLICTELLNLFNDSLDELKNIKK